MYIPSNFSVDEILDTFPSSQGLDRLREALEKERQTADEVETALDELLKSSELVEEQLGFAETLVDLIGDFLKQNGTKKQLVESIRAAIEESLLEV